MTPPATNEERQAAVQLLRESGVVSAEGLTVFTLETLVALTRTEARNAALEAQVKKARELIESYKEALWAHHDSDSRIDPWLEATR